MKRWVEGKCALHSCPRLSEISNCSKLFQLNLKAFSQHDLWFMKPKKSNTSDQFQEEGKGDYFLNVRKTKVKH